MRSLNRKPPGQAFALMPSKTQSKFDAIKRKQLEELARAAVIDEAGRLELKLAPFKADLKRLETLRKAIRGWYDTEAAGRSFSPHGDDYVATVGPCGFQAVIHDMRSIFETVGTDEFLAACQLSLGALEGFGKPGLAEAVTAQEQTGPRSLALQPIRPVK